MNKTFLVAAVAGFMILVGAGCSYQVDIKDQNQPVVEQDQNTNQQATEVVQKQDEKTTTPATDETKCYKKYSGNLSPLLVANFEYPCTWTVPVTGGKITSPDGTAVMEYPAPDVGLPNEIISSGDVLIDGINYQKTIYKNGNIFVEYVDLGTIEQYRLNIIFHYTNAADKNEFYRILKTFELN